MSVDEIVNDIQNGIVSTGGADYIQLIEQVGMIRTIAELILGLFVTIIIIGLPVIIALEICYINFPVMQASFNNILNKTSGNINSALGLVLRDAKIALTRANTVETGRDVNYIYLLIKLKAILIAIFSVGLVIGVGPIIVQLIIKIASSIIEGFRGVI